jgi:hypothetical protein
LQLYRASDRSRYFWLFLFASKTMRPVAQHALSRKALMRYNGWSCVGSYLDVADRASLTDAFGIGRTALNAADAEYPVMFAAIHRNTFEKIRALEYLDGLLIPRREHAHSLSLQQRSRLWLGKFALVFYSEQIGWGVESAGAIPSGTLLFPYYGEFISSMEAKLRYQDNKRIQVVIPPSFPAHIHCRLTTYFRTCKRK